MPTTTLTRPRQLIVALAFLIVIPLLGIAQHQKALEKLKPDQKEKIEQRLAELEVLIDAMEPIRLEGPKWKGCGPWFLPGITWFLNAQTFEGDSNTTVNVIFKPACDLHDAGYGGLYVYDTVGYSPTVDYGRWTKESIDRKFLYDLVRVCERTIPSSNKKALENCKFGRFGASDYQRAVSELGYPAFDCNPRKPGLQILFPCTRGWYDDDKKNKEQSFESVGE